MSALSRVFSSLGQMVRVPFAFAMLGAGLISGSSSASAALPAAVSLSASDVNTVLAYAGNEASRRGVNATIAVVDRVGNVLSVMRTSGQTVPVKIGGLLKTPSGLDGLALDALATTDADALAAIAKAVTGAYLSSSGNAFSTRTASQIVQKFFNPQETNQPGGPLFGVQFSQLPCSDLSVRFADSATLGPKRSPLGLSADPGGFPLYKSGVVVGGVGVISDKTYSLDANILNVDKSTDEMIALAGTYKFQAPSAIMAQAISVNGRYLRYSDVGYSSISRPASTPALPSGVTYPAVDGYTSGGSTALDGQTYGLAASGYMSDTTTFGTEVVVLAEGRGSNRYPPTDSTTPTTGANGGLTAAEVTRIITEAVKVAKSARAQIRKPVGSYAQVTVSVVDADGNVLGLARTVDAPVFGTDVSLQKARGALLFSRPDAATILQTTSTTQAVPSLFAEIPTYVTRFRGFVQSNALSNGIAYSSRAVGNLARPFYPDGSPTSGTGPLSARSLAKWSPFADGLQLDLVANDLVTHLSTSSRGTEGAKCGSILSTTTSVVANGIQIFAGGEPIYRTINGVSTLIGAIGISGDGIDQDDMIGFLGVAKASAALGTGFGHAPASKRADTLSPGGIRLRYVNCPFQPFLSSSTQDACTGL